MSSPVAGALSVTPLYTTPADALVSWDDPGQTWRSLAYLPLSGGTISGNLTITGLLSANSVELGPDDGVTTPYIDFHGATTWTDYATRLIRFAGDNGQFVIASRGTGGLNFYSMEAGPFILGTSNTERLRIAPAGNVGIGTPSPLQTLHVRTGTDHNTRFGGQWTGPANSQSIQCMNDANNAYIPLEFAASAFYFSTGNVGIGTTTATYKLNVGNGTGAQIIGISSAGSGTGNGGAVYFMAGAGVTSAVGGYSAIYGTAYDPALMLYSTTYSIFPAGAVYNVSGTWTVISGREMKDEIAPYTRGLEALRQLQPVVFRYRAGTVFARADEPSEPQLGLIADEVEPYLPELVGETTTMVGKEEVVVASLTPGNVVYALINSIKELAARVEALEARGAA